MRRGRVGCFVDVFAATGLPLAPTPFAPGISCIPWPHCSLWSWAPLSLMSSSVTLPGTLSLSFLQSRLRHSQERVSCLYMAGLLCPTWAPLAWPGAFPGSLADGVVVGGMRHGTMSSQRVPPGWWPKGHFVLIC